MSLYTDYKEDICNLSYWYPKIKDCGFLVPETFIMPVPEDIMMHFFMEGGGLKPAEHEAIIYKWVIEKLMPNIPESLRGLIFIKNGCFSNKFDFKTCAIRYNAHMLTTSLIEINYTSLMYDTSGNTEVIIRERIPYDERNTPCIYNGMPLRPEYRVFYDFDEHKVLKIVNYWDWDYCHEQISRCASDKIIYESYYPILEKKFNEGISSVEKAADTFLGNVKTMNGIWSVDILQGEQNDLWLIDMAPGFRSAYWEKVKEV